jgi:hypothetical protein
MFGKMGAMAPLVDPFAGAAAGFGAAGVGGAMAGAALPLGLAFGASRYAGAFVGGGQQQMAIGNQLGGMNFINPAARSGIGFSRDDAQAIGNVIRQIASVPEMLTSVEELTRMIPRLRQAGVMTGVRDAGEFSRRFQESIHTIRDMSKILGTTMDQASEFFSQSRSVGFYGRQATIQNVLQAQFTAGVTGMSGGQVMQLQQAGAGMAQAMGAQRVLGARAVTNIAQQLGMAQQNGALREGQLENITGLQGPEATQAAAQRLTQVMMNIAQNPVGRLAMAGMVKFDATGKAIGMDEEMVGRLQRGEVTTSELMQRAGRLNARQRTSFMARQADLITSFAGQAGLGGVGALVKGVGEKMYGSEGTNIILQRQGGMSASEADIFADLIGQGGAGQGLRGFAERQQMEAQIRERTSPDAIFRRLKTRLANSMGITQVRQAGAEMTTAIGRAFDNFIDDAVGRHVITLSKEGADTIARAMARGRGQELFSQALGGGAGGAGTAGPLSGAQMFRESSVGAFLMRGAHDTGRTGAAQAGVMAERFLGASSLTGFGIAAGGMSAENLRKLEGIVGAQTEVARKSGAGAAGRGAFEDILRGSVGRDFGEMTPERQMDEARSAATKAIANQLANKIGGLSAAGFQAAMQGGNMQDMMQRIQAAGGVDKVLGPGLSEMFQAGLKAQGASGIKDFGTAMAIAASAGGLFQVGGKVSAAGVTSEKAIAGAQEAGRKAESALRGMGLDASDIQMLQSKPEARKLLLASSTDDKVRTALESGSPEEALKKLVSMNYNVSLDDIIQLRNVSMGANAERRKDIASNVAQFESLKQIEDSTAAVQMMSKAGDSVQRRASEVLRGPDGTPLVPREDLESVEGLAAALKGVGTKGGADRVRTAMHALTERVGKATGKQREALIAAAGEFGERAAQISGARKRLMGRSVSTDDISRAFGVSKDDLTESLNAIRFKSGGKLSESDFATLQTAAEGAAGFRGAAGRGGAAASVQSEMLTTLQKLNKSLDLNSTIIASLGKDATQDMKDKALKGLKEVTDSKGT